MTYSLSNNCTKNYYNRTLTVQVIVEDVVTWIFLKHSVFADAIDELSDKIPQFISNVCLSYSILYLRCKFHSKIPNDCQFTAGHFNLGHPVESQNKRGKTFFP